MLFKLVKGGPHTEAGKIYKVGDTIETDRPLDEIFKRLGKFERVNGSPDDVGGGGAPPTKYGSDVTSMMEPSLLDKGLRLYKKGSWYFVVDLESDTQLNEKGLREKDVADFVKPYLDED